MAEFSDIKTDQRNANKHTLKGKKILEQSLERVGAGRSIVLDGKNNVVAGNSTAETAHEKGFKLKIVDQEPDEIVAVRRKDWDLDDDDPNNPARQYAYFDNAAGEAGLEWDLEQIAADHEAGFDFDGIFEGPRLDGMLQKVGAELQRALDQSHLLEDTYAIIVQCLSEQHQAELLRELLERGITCRSLIS